jgi:predicted Zn-dependent protease with MMP-like domain
MTINFESLVVQALEELPAEFANAIENVEIVVEIWPSPMDLQAAGIQNGMTLFGLYRGIPKTQRGTYQAVLPDKISIFAGPIVAAFGHDPDKVKRHVRDTVLHEIGHHFGMSEQQIRSAGK